MPWSAGSYTRWNTGNTPPYWVGDASVGIKIEASRHDTQDADFEAGINACLNKDGSNAATGNLNIGGNKITNVGSATVSTDVPTYAQLLAIIPTGAITAYGAGSAPSGWLLCDGTAVNRTTYATLFGIIGTTYGVGDGSTTFNIPNLQQKFPLGKAASGTGATLGGTGGAIDHTHTSAAHTHTVASHTHGMASHTHTAAHSHTLSDAGAAKVTYTSTDTFLGRTNTASWSYTATTAPDVPWAASSSTQSTGAGLVGSTDSATPTTSGPSSANTDGTALTTDSTTPGATGANNPPYLVVNYIIKT
jgi:microcystin-dependent protein